MPTLEVLNGMSRRSFDVNGRHAFIGRDRRCDVWLRFDEISREHAELFRVSEEWFIKDCGSRNGTYVNQELLQPGVRRALRQFDQIQICDVVFRFLDESATDLDTPPVTPGGVKFKSTPSDCEPEIISSLDMSDSSSFTPDTIAPDIKLKAILEITQKLRCSLRLDEVLDRVLESLFDVFPVTERGFVALKSPGDELPVCRALRHKDKDQRAPIPISRAIVESAMGERRAMLTNDARADFDNSESVSDAMLHSVMCAPLLDNRNAPLGIIQLDARHSFNREDLEVFACAATLVAFAVENSQLHSTVVDLEVARTIQRSLLPNTAPLNDHYEFFDFYLPARLVGGDYFDYIELPGNRLGIVLADVSGKGVGAALLMVKLASEMRVYLASEYSPVDAVNRLNTSFSDQGPEGRFVTLVLVVLDFNNHQLTVVNAGHERPLLLRSDGTLIELGDKEAGCPIGLRPGYLYEPCRVQMEFNDAVILYTDGVTDARNPYGERYTQEQLVETIKKQSTVAGVLGPAIIRSVRGFNDRAPRVDDICLVAFSRKDESH